MQTYIIYIGLLLVCYLVSKDAEKKDKKNKIYIIIILLTLVAGLRGESVGLDTNSYMTKFEYISNGQFGYAYGLEMGFKLLCYVLLRIVNNSTFLFLCLAFVTNALMILRFWDYKDIASFPCMVVCYYIGFYFSTMNITRQLCGIAILFYCTKMLKEQKYIRFILITVLTGIFIHQTALIGLGFLALEVFQWKMLSSKQRVLLLMGMLMLPVALIYVMNAMSRYEKYFSSIQVDIGIMLPIKILFVLFTSFIASGGNISKMFTGRGNYEENSVRIYYVLGILLSFLGYFFTFVQRIGWYYYIYEGVYMGMLLKTRSRNNKKVYIFCLIVLFGYMFMQALVGDGQGVVPYKFVWQ